MWDPYFGKTVKNARGLEEDTLSYVLRHTQKRPRQVILLCNSIAELAMTSSGFPVFSDDQIKRGIKSTESELAVEIINSYSSLYSNVSNIVNGLMNTQMLFSGKELDKRAPETASFWPPGTYSKAKFRRLVTELGIVGRVQDKGKGYLGAIFEYSLRDGLDLTHRDECVIHPMFYSRFNVSFNSELRVIPLSTEFEGQPLDEEFP